MLFYVRLKRAVNSVCHWVFITFYSLALNAIEAPNAGLFVESTVLESLSQWSFPSQAYNETVRSKSSRGRLVSVLLFKCICASVNAAVKSQEADETIADVECSVYSQTWFIYFTIKSPIIGDNVRYIRLLQISFIRLLSFTSIFQKYDSFLSVKLLKWGHDDWEKWGYGGNNSDHISNHHSLSIY